MKTNILYTTFGVVMSLLLISACQPRKTGEDAITEPKTAGPVTPPHAPLGNQQLMQLYSTADHVDIIFYDLPISVNQDDASSVKNTVLYISPAAPIITGTCKALGRLSWMSKGVIIREADVYCAPGCEYLLFMENNAPVAANAMVPAGVEFFNNIISQVAKRSQ